jgi:hypothetical protein
MDQFVFTRRLRIILGLGMLLGVICLGLTWAIDDELHTRFWSNFLHNSVFFTGISFIATFFIAVCITAWAGWYVLFKRVWEAYSYFLIVGFVLMAILALGVVFHWHHLYHWADPSTLDPNSANYDELLVGKSGFLNVGWYAIFGLFIVGLWFFFAHKLRNLSLDEDKSGGDKGFKHHTKMRIYAAAFLPIAGFSSAAVIWLWIMSVDSHWYSTLYAWYTGASWFVSMICVTILMILFLKSKGLLKEVNQEHLHDLGKFLFAFSIFWAYLWFSQYMLIWYANVGEETEYFKTRIDHYPVLFYGNLVLNFALPFLALMRNDAKRKFGSLGAVAVIVLFGHWWDFFQMIKPGVAHTAAEHLAHAAESGHEAAGHVAYGMGFTFPGLLELGTLVGFLCLFAYFGLHILSKNVLLPKNDPYLAESLHHHA